MVLDTYDLSAAFMSGSTPYPFWYLRANDCETMTREHDSKAMTRVHRVRTADEAMTREHDFKAMTREHRVRTVEKGESVMTGLCACQHGACTPTITR